ncbi:MAG: hypothetical protein LBU06_10835 [Desulfovibrio sp.]|nr:hypothetical protein [Desulfovibrio sp.]
MALSAPMPLTAAHDIADFFCGEPLLDDWLRRRATKNETSGASRTYVVCSGNQVAGYCSLAAGSIEHRVEPL